MHPELEKYIDFAVTDTKVSTEEKNVLIRKAGELGVELDELEMALNAKLHQVEAQHQLNKSNHKIANKCPQCSALIESFSTKCTYCDAEIRNINATYSVTDFFHKMNELENPEKKKTVDFEKIIQLLLKVEMHHVRNLALALASIVALFVTLHFTVGPDVLGTILAVIIGLGLLGFSFWSMNKPHPLTADQNINTFINNYPIPNTKEDILEFLYLAVPRAKSNRSVMSTLFNPASQFHSIGHDKMIPVWKSKCEQIIIKARFLLKDDKKILEEIEYYAKQLKIK